MNAVPKKKKVEANLAVKKASLIAPDVCEKCGEARRVLAHHEDYDKPLDVLWLCFSCHAKRHTELGGWQRGRPKFTDGKVNKVQLLLSNKHITYLKTTGNLSAKVRALVDADIKGVNQ